jgi:hypothetical protein
VSTGAHDTRDKRQATYDHYASILHGLAEVGDDHRQRHPECDAEPLCLGAPNLLTVVRRQANPTLVLIVAARELARAEKRAAGLRGRMEVQRSLTADACRALDSANEREEQLRREIDWLEDERQQLLARLDDVEHEKAIEP